MGSIDCRSGSPTITNCVAKNADSCGGAGISIEAGCAPIISNCTVKDNVGGGIRCSADVGQTDHPTITGCIITGNERNTGAAVLCEQRSKPTISNCLIHANVSDAFDPNDPGADINYSTIRVEIGCDVTLTNCTITGNSGDSHGPCLPVGSTDGDVTITNCIIWGNSGNYAIGLFDWTAFAPTPTVTVSYSDVEGGENGVWLEDPNTCTLDWDPNSNITSDPFFLDPNGDDYRIDPNSPCIDAGDNSAVPTDEWDADGDGRTSEAFPFDLNGYNHRRFVDDPNTTDTGSGDAPIVDMGAYEFPSCVGDVDCDGDVDLTDLVLLNDALDTCINHVDYEPNADFNDDGCVDKTDQAALLENYNTSCW
jgi:hypothetical protein